GIGLIILSLAVLGAQANQPLTLLITEVFYDTPGADGEREWIEIANVGTAVLDLSDVKIGDEETAGGNEGMHRFPDLARIEPGQAVVVAQSAAGFRELYARNPDYEINDTDPNVPDMRGFPLWAGGDLALANDGDEVLLLQGMAVLDAINYGDSHAYFSPAIGDIVTGQSIERFPANCDTDTAADWQPQTTPAPGSIGAIQGDGDASPFLTQIITFRGVVTGAYEDRNASGVTFYTLFVQDAPGYEDGDPDTSDGMAVFLGRKRPSYQPGDQVRITGLVAEFFGYTEIDDAGLEIRVEAGDTPLPAPIAITPPTGAGAQAAYFEPLESMLVALDGAARVVGPTYSGCGFTVVRADSGLDRVFRRRAADPAGPVVTVLHHSDVHCDGFPDVRVGDGVKGVRGPLIYNFDQFKIVQQETDGLAVTAVPLPPLPPPPMPTGAQFSVATFNVENYFDSLDDTGTDAEPKPTDDEIAAKQTKLAYAIGHTLGCPTLIGVQEVEKESLLLDLAAATADVCGFTYNITHRESPDARGIDVALLNDPRRVTVTGTALRQGCTLIDTGIDDETITCEPGKQPLFSRPPLQVDVTIDGVGYTIFVNHFKSKRGG
ncbi:MAG: lamin tail domain-containing protein, partial [Anaerolineae bacterium]